MSDAANFIKAKLGKDCREFTFTVRSGLRTGYRKYVPVPIRERRPGASAMKLVERSWRQFHGRDIRLFVGPGVFRVGPDEYVEMVDAVSVGEEMPPSFDVIYALPGCPMVDVVEFCRVGSHEAPQPTDVDFWQWLEQAAASEGEASVAAVREAKRKQAKRGPKSHSDEPWLRVREAMAEIFAIAAFEVQLACPEALWGTFLEQVGPKHAKQIAQIIWDVNFEAGDLALGELERLGHAVPQVRGTDGIPDGKTAIAQYIGASGRMRLWWD